MPLVARCCVFVLLLLALNASEGSIQDHPESRTVQEGQRANFTCKVATIQNQIGSRSEPTCPTVHWYRGDQRILNDHDNFNISNPRNQSNCTSTLHIFTTKDLNETVVQCVDSTHHIYSKLAVLIVNSTTTEDSDAVTESPSPTPVVCPTSSPFPERVITSSIIIRTASISITSTLVVCPMPSPSPERVITSIVISTVTVTETPTAATTCFLTLTPSNGLENTGPLPTDSSQSRIAANVLSVSSLLMMAVAILL